MDLTTTVASLTLDNPTILASGVMGEDAGSIKRIIKSNAGAVVTKSIGVKPREGYPNPTVVALEHGILNAMGLPNPGINDFSTELNHLIQSSSTPIIGSIFGEKTNEFIELGKKMEEHEVHALELNLSCPHVKGFGHEVGSDAQFVEKITNSVKENVGIPVFVKLSPNVTDIVSIAKAAENGGADGIIAINTVKAMKIDIETKKPVLANGTGGYSGPAVKPIGIRCVYTIAEEVSIPIIGAGGVTSGDDAVEYLMAGASAVQIAAGLYYRDLDIFKNICDEMQRWMKEHGYQRVTDLIGVAHD